MDTARRFLDSMVVVGLCLLLVACGLVVCWVLLLMASFGPWGMFAGVLSVWVGLATYLTLAKE